VSPTVIAAVVMPVAVTTIAAVIAIVPVIARWHYDRDIVSGCG
jgi:hypothetical protein